MSGKPNKWHSCIQKRKYNEENDTHTELNRLKRVVEPWRSHALISYKCIYCKGWHIGNDTRMLKRAISLHLIKKGMSQIKAKLNKKERKILGSFIGYLISQHKNERNCHVV